MKIEDLDVVYISFDEPNAEYNYANLVSKFPWAKRVHGVKGFDAAHKAACDLSETDYVVTVDGDAIVDTRFFKVDIDLDNYRPNTVFSYNSVNNINGLVYGNGGVKVWPKSVLQSMQTHEASNTDQARVDFCWEDFYHQSPNIYSVTVQNGSAYQAFRSGFREGVKLSLINGTRVSADQLEEKQWPINIKRLKIWMTVGTDVEYGEYSIYGAKLGFYKTICTDWDYTLISDYDWFYNFWKTVEFKNDKLELVNKVKAATGWDLPYLNAEASRLVKQVHFDSNK